MSESDIVRSVKNTKYSPLQSLAARYFKEDPDNVDITKDSILIWNDEINDYKSYRYCTEDIEKINNFIDEWNDFLDKYVEDFVLEPIVFCVEQNKKN